MIRRVVFILIAISLFVQASYVHQFQLNVSLAKYYENQDGYTDIPISGTHNIKIEVVDIDLEQPIWSHSEEQYLNNGDISMIISDPDINWLDEVENKSLIFRISVVEDQVDIPFEYLPYAVYSQRANQFKQFNDINISNINYSETQWDINQSGLDVELGVSGSIVSDYFVGSGIGLYNLTGAGFNDYHSLNSQNGFHKDILYVSSTGNVGIFTLTPNARVHVKGSIAFKGDYGGSSDYTIPSGNILLWDPYRVVFRSGVFNSQFQSSDYGKYSIAFGEDVETEAHYSSILGGEDHLINLFGVASVILGGQANKIYDSYSIAAGGYLNRIWGEWSVLFGGYENTSFGDFNVILGGEYNYNNGVYNLLIGSNNFLDSEYSVVIGSNNNVSANRSVILGDSINVHSDHMMSFIYSNSNEDISSNQSKQFVIYSDNGVGVNRLPTSDYTLSVSGNVSATHFYGDGQNLINIQDYEAFWKSNDSGIYYLDGSVAIGTTNVVASLTVDGSITLGSTQQGGLPVNGTLQFQEDYNLLSFYVNDWVTVNMQDNDTLLNLNEDDLIVSQQKLNYLKFIEVRDSVDFIFGSNGFLSNGLQEWYSSQGFYDGHFIWFDYYVSERDLINVLSIKKSDEGNNYSYKWTGYFIPNESASYTFKTVSDEMSHVVIDSTVVINNTGVTQEGSIYLEQNTPYPISIYFGESEGGAEMEFFWRGGSQIDFTTDLSTLFYVVNNPSFDINAYEIFYQPIDQNIINIAQKDAVIDNVLRNNGLSWFAYDAKVWNDHENGLFVDEQDVNISVSGNSFEYPLVIGTNPSLDGSNTEYPLVVGLTDSASFSPRDHSLMLNLDYQDATKQRYILKSESSMIPENSKNYGALIQVDNDVYKLHFTDQPYGVGEVVNLENIFNISSESFYLGTDTPQATFDTQGSLGFLNTFVEHRNANNLKGFGHKYRQDEVYPYYFYLDDSYDTYINSGTDLSAETINFMINGNKEGYFNSDGELIVGDGDARAKLSILEGGIALNIDSGQFGATSYAGKRFVLASKSYDDPSLEVTYGNNVIADLGDEKISFGSNQSINLISFYSETVPNIQIFSNDQSRFIFEGQDTAFTMQNISSDFSLVDENNYYLFSRGLDSHVAFLTDTVSDISSFGINGDIEISNNDALIFSNQNREDIMSFSKDGDNLIIQQENSAPILMTSIDKSPILMVTTNGKVAINSILATENAEVYIVESAWFKQPIFYNINGDKKKVQALTVKDNVNTFRSIKEIVVDEFSGIRLSIDSDNTVTLKAPGVYEKMYDTRDAIDRQYIQPNPKDTLTLSEHIDGLEVTLIDTDNNNIPDSIELYNTLIDGGEINGDVTVNGQVYVENVGADGSKVYNIPFYWQLTGAKLYYSSGNVGISIASPNYELDIRDTAFTDELYVSENAYIKHIDFENSTKTTISNQDITFWLDKDNDETDESFLFRESDTVLMSVMEHDSVANYPKIGIYGNAGFGTNFHVYSLQDQPMSVLLGALGESANIVFAGDLTTANINLNRATGLSEYGTVNQLVFQTPKKMEFKVGGVSGLYLNNDSVSLTEDTSFNSFYVHEDARIGSSYAEDSMIQVSLGMIVEGAGTIGNERAADGYVFYSNQNMSIGIDADSIISDRDLFNGVVVENQVGVGIQDPSDSDDLVSVDGDVSIRRAVTLYDDQTPQFIIDRNGEFFVNEYVTDDLVFQLSDYTSFSIGDFRSLTVYDNLVTIGNIPPEDSDIPQIRKRDEDANFVIYSEHISSALLKDKVSNPTITFSTQDGARNSMMGLDSSGDFQIESNGLTLDDPDITIKRDSNESYVGIGKDPGYNLDVSGDVKANYLYKTINGHKLRLYPVPIGGIMMWHGSIEDIPDGWFLCDGQTYTDKYGRSKAVPDLRQRFIIGQDASTSIGDIGGDDNGETHEEDGDHTHIGGDHTHYVSGDSHSHGLTLNNASGKDSHSDATKPGDSTVDVYDDYCGQEAKDKHSGHGETCETGQDDLWQPKSHNHSVDSDHGHSASITNDQGASGSLVGNGNHHLQSNTTAGTHSHDGGEHVHTWDNQPPYYILAFIIKIY